MLERLEFSIGGIFTGYKTVTIWTQDETMYVTYRGDRREPDHVYSKAVTALKRQKLEDRLEKIKINSWKKAYEDPSVLDGTQWELAYKEQGKRRRHISGSNAYPENWNDFIGAIGVAVPEIRCEKTEEW